MASNSKSAQIQSNPDRPNAPESASSSKAHESNRNEDLIKETITLTESTCSQDSKLVFKAPLGSTNYRGDLKITGHIQNT